MTDAQGIVEALGGTWYGSYGLTYCPAHDNTKTPALSVANSDSGKILAHCHAGCSFEEIMSAFRGLGLIGAQTMPAVQQIGLNSIEVNLSSQRERSERARGIWQASQPIVGSPVEAYLRSRGIGDPLSPKLRYSPYCHHPSGQFLPAMVGLVEGSAGFAVHCTFLDPETGQKLRVEPTKIMVGPVKGGAVRLFQGDGGLIVGEGIETVLSLLHGFEVPPFSGWAALSTSGLRSMRLPPDPSQLIIAADGDKAGREAAHELARRAEALGWNVVIGTAPQGKDWNDVLQEGETWA